jgi:hypothetical protein
MVSSRSKVASRVTSSFTKISHALATMKASSSMNPLVTLLGLAPTVHLCQEPGTPVGPVSNHGTPQSTKPPASLKLATSYPDPRSCCRPLVPVPKELTMTLEAVRAEPTQVEQTRRQLEHKVGACRSSALVLTLEGLPDQLLPTWLVQHSSKSSSGSSASHRHLH